MRLDEILHGCDCELVYMDEDTGEILDESFIRQLKKVGAQIKRQFRCTSGPKKGKIVAHPKECAKRKDPKRRRIGRKSAKLKKATRITKTKLAKRRGISKKITRLNKQLAGK